MTEGSWCIYNTWVFSDFEWANSEATVLNGFPGIPVRLSSVCSQWNFLGNSPFIAFLPFPVSLPQIPTVFWNHFLNTLFALEYLSQDLILVEHKLRKVSQSIGWRDTQVEGVLCPIVSRTHCRKGRRKETNGFCNLRGHRLSVFSLESQPLLLKIDYLMSMLLWLKHRKEKNLYWKPIKTKDFVLQINKIFYQSCLCS